MRIFRRATGAPQACRRRSRSQCKRGCRCSALFPLKLKVSFSDVLCKEMFLKNDLFSKPSMLRAVTRLKLHKKPNSEHTRHVIQDLFPHKYINGFMFILATEASQTLNSFWI